MAYVFDLRTQVLGFFPNLPRKMWSSRQFFLWPVLGYQVVAPEPREEELDILQRAVLSLSRAGVRRAIDQAEALHLHVELLGHVMAGLIQSGLMLPDGRLTSVGIEVLDSDADTGTELITGWVLQDPWTLQLWPRFLHDLEFAETSIQGNHLRLELGTPGKPRSERAFVVFPRGGMASRTPSAEEIIEVVRLGAKARQKISTHAQWDPLGEEEECDDQVQSITTLADRSVDISRVSYIKEDPQPFLLVTFAFLPADVTSGAHRWEAAGPFSPRPHPRLRQWIAREAKQKPIMTEWLRGLIQNAPEPATEHEWFALAKADALVRVEEALPTMQRLSISNEQADTIIRSLGIAEEDLQIAERTGEALRTKTVARETGLVLEKFIGILNDEAEFRDYRATEELPKSDNDQEYRSRVRPMIEGAIKRLTNVPAPHGLLAGARTKNLKNAFKIGNRESARPRMAAAALNAKYVEDHPLRIACAEEPHLIELFDQVCQARNDASHDGKPPPGTENARQILRSTYVILERIAAAWLKAREPQNLN